MAILPMVKVMTKEKVSSMCEQHYGEPSNIQEEYNPRVYGESMEKKMRSIINSIGEQSTLEQPLSINQLLSQIPTGSGFQTTPS